MTMPISATSRGEATIAPPKPIWGASRIVEIGADRIEGAVGEVDDAAEREDQRQAERDQEVIDPVEQPVQYLLDEEGEQGRLPGLLSAGRCGILAAKALPSWSEGSEESHLAERSPCRSSSIERSRSAASPAGRRSCGGARPVSSHLADGLVALR